MIRVSSIALLLSASLSQGNDGTGSLPNDTLQDNTPKNVGEPQASSSNAVIAPSVPSTPQKLDQLSDDALQEVGRFLDPQSAQNLSLTSKKLKDHGQKALLMNASKDGAVFDLSTNNVTGIPARTVDDVTSFLKQANAKNIKNIKLTLYYSDTGTITPTFTVDDLDEILALCDNVSNLTLSLDNLDDTYLQPMNNTLHLNQLTHLTLNARRNPSLTSTGFQALSTLPSLTHLDLSGMSPLDNTALDPLKNLKYLTSLVFSIHPQFSLMQGIRQNPVPLMNMIQEMPHLQELRLSDVAVNDELLEKVLTRPLTKLSIIGGTMTDASVQNLVESQLSQTLEFLNLNNNAVTNTGFRSLTSIKGLRHLSLDGNRISVIPDLSPFQNLNMLSLSRNQIDDAGLLGLSGGLSLKELNLSQNQITDANIRTITRLPQLITLNLRRNHITNYSTRFLAQSPKLKSLDIGENSEITLRGIKILAESHNRFTRLDVTGTNTYDISDGPPPVLPSLTLGQLQAKFPFILAAMPAIP